MGTVRRKTGHSVQPLSSLYMQGLCIGAEAELLGGVGEGSIQVQGFGGSAVAGPRVQVRG